MCKGEGRRASGAAALLCTMCSSRRPSQVEGSNSDPTPAGCCCGGALRDTCDPQPGEQPLENGRYPGEDVEEREPWCSVGGNVKWCNHYAKQYGGSSKNSKQISRTIYCLLPSNSTTGYTPKGTICTPVFITALFTIVKTWQLVKCYQQMNG